MAKSKFEKNILPRLLEIKDWARNGAIEEDIAIKLNVSYSRFRDYKADPDEKYEPLRKALQEGEEQANGLVENKLFERTQGKTVEVRKVFKVKEVIYSEKTGRRLSEKEHLETAVEEIYIPPDVTALIFWLKNRLPELWRDKIDATVDMNGNLTVIFQIPRPEKDADNS